MSTIADESTVLEETVLPGEEEETTTETTETRTPEQTAMDELRGTVDTLRGKAEVIDQLAPLIPAAKALMEKLAAPKDAGPGGPTPDELRAIGEKLQGTFTTGKPEDVAAMFIDAVQRISGNRVETELARVASPVVERLADFTLSSYLSMKRGEDPAKEKTHDLIARRLELTDQDKVVLGSGSAKEARALLDRRYKEAAGEVLLGAKPRAKNIGGGSGGGAGSGSSGIGSAPPPGFSARDWEQQLRTLEVLWPDEKVRAQKERDLRDFISSGGE